MSLGMLEGNRSVVPVRVAGEETACQRIAPC